MKYCGVLIAGVIGLTALGCGGPSPVPASGTITHNGQPVADATVIFTPVGGATGEAGGAIARGQTDAQGKFTLTTTSPSDGALPGEYRVSVTPKAPERAEDDYSAEPEPPFPTMYADPTATPLKATVNADGENDFSLEMTDQ